ncbi:hypothetical protein [Flavobacterium glaciei]|uniref:Uncharacterized protein n=1 Tax=Flavobacterium glaciei TaxID=386300 RepID=A0A562PP43_9FLAO|nr:hypothetical protein [Flavobacterium glaciei]RDI52459.1 hypothetical protein DFR66_11036 [Flavobacterium glaciei]TWI46207.1 hypothetical protein IQ02_02037 [Flavobacterium glaciei]
MKTTLVVAIALLFSLQSQGQNKNVKSEIKTTVTTIKDSKGEKQLVKTQEIKETQNIELKNAESDELNKEIKQTPVQVTAITAVTSNGVTKILDVDRSAYYNYNGQKFQVALAETGYNMYLPNKEKTAVLRKTSNNNYIYSTKNKTSFGYFNADGNLVLESYDPVNDKITTEIFEIIKE